MEPITGTATIPAPAERVWAQISDVRRWADWLPTVTSVTPLDPAQPEAVGSRYVMEQPRIPRATWRITRWDPPQAFTWESSAPGVHSTGAHTVEDLGDGRTRACLSIEWTGPLSPLVRLVYGRMTQRYVDTEAARLAAESTA